MSTKDKTHVVDLLSFQKLLATGNSEGPCNTILIKKKFGGGKRQTWKTVITTRFLKPKLGENIPRGMPEKRVKKLSQCSKNYSEFLPLPLNACFLTSILAFSSANKMHVMNILIIELDCEEKIMNE